MNITTIKGIGESTAALFAKLNIYETGDLIKYFPKDYTFYASPSSINTINAGELAVIRATCTCDASNRYVRGMNILTARISDGTGEMGVVIFNMPYVRGTLKKGTEHIFRGVASRRGEMLVLQQPRIFKPENYDKLANTWQPIYTTTKGLSVNTIQKSVKKAIEAEQKLDINSPLSPLRDPLPEEIVNKRGFIAYSQAVLTMHMPDSLDALVEARRRLVYQEFYDFIYNIEINRSSEHRINHFPMIEVADTTRLIEGLPFELTDDQKTVWDTISADMSGPHGLARLLQGDVGSGKTIIAILALLMCVANGYQGAFMAPTDVLANQHFKYICELASNYKLPIKPILFTGAVKGKARKESLTQIESGEANLIIGTHALFSEAVEYKNLALVITDEQHRFGVLQRQALMDKGNVPHVMIMSATPIPRTLAMILYGDLEVSTIHNMPMGRKPIKNCVVDTSYREKAYEFITKQVEEGNKVYIICAQVEAGDKPEIENVTDYTIRLKSTLPDWIRIEGLHGQMKQNKKDQIMQSFADGQIDVLVSTTVVEVGVNVPDATLMYVENAERFGLAQLHQLRGRVGRSDKQSYCIFMMGQKSEIAQKRLKILENSNDGFEIASEDMKMRGPGDIFGIRQSGEMLFALGDIYQDGDLVTMAAEDVKSILNK